jgi:predicted RNA-binding protein with PIN domain
MNDLLQHVRQTMKRTIIDGHNFILTVESLADRLAFEGKRASRHEAERLVLEWAERADEENVHIVYDGEKFPGGHPGNRDEGPLRVRFTDPPAEADDLIAYEAKEASEKGESVVVVTADKDLAKKAKRSGAKVVSTEDFYFEITRAPVHAHKEEHFTDEQLAELETAMMERAVEEPEEEEAPVGEITPEPWARHAEPADEEPARAVPETRAAVPHTPPNRDERRARYLERMKRRGPEGGAQKPKPRKKRRGF